tara:strand:+ start:335 stop:502 length:168 start_codon:yes stop_codon:yes gene_type:complete
MYVCGVFRMKTAIKLFNMFKKHNLCEDRREYDVEDLMFTYSGLSLKEAKKLKEML